MAPRGAFPERCLGLALSALVVALCPALCRGFPFSSPQGAGVFERLNRPAAAPRPRVRVYDLTRGGTHTSTSYDEVWALQRRLFDERVAARRAGRPCVDAAVVVEHGAVYTLGAGATDEHVLPSASPLVRVERGGDVTYHGPGQVVLYPVLTLDAHHRADLHWYLRALEEVAIRAAAAHGVAAERCPEYTGVWDARGAKLAAVGVKVRGWVTMHGLSLNVAPDLGAYAHIVPCGVSEKPVGSLRDAPDAPAGGAAVDVAGAVPLVLDAFRDVFEVDLELVQGAPPVI